MSNIDNIIKKLNEEANEKINRIEAESREKGDHERQKIVEIANIEVEGIMDWAKAEAEQTYERIISNAELKVRDQKLFEQQKLFDRVFKLALDKLNLKSDVDFSEEIKKALKAINSDNLTLVVPKERVAGLKALNLNAKISEDEFVDNGFLIKSDRMIYNYKLDDLISAKREDLELELAKKLFKN